MGQITLWDVNLEFFSPSKKPIILSVLGDTEVAKERIYDFVDAYNTFQATAKEMSKFDKSSNTAAPLLSDRNLAQMVNEVATTTIATVSGLPQTTNMLFSIGLKIDDRGLMSIDEKKLNEKIVDNFIPFKLLLLIFSIFLFLFIKLFLNN